MIDWLSGDAPGATGIQCKRAEARAPHLERGIYTARMTGSWKSFVVAAFDACDSFFELGVIHGYEVTRFGKAPAMDVVRIFLERSGTFLLEAFVFLKKIPVRLRMAGNAFVIVSEDIVREKELRVAATARPQGHQE